jgi:PPOX class probable F420-dependent enzyme
MSALRDDVRRVLDGTSIAHLATVLPDGAPHVVPVFIGTHQVGADGEGTPEDRIVFFTGPEVRKARNLRRDPRVALSIAPADNPFEPVVIRGRVVEWIDGDAGWEIIDRLAAKYTGRPYPRDQQRIVGVIEPEHQTVGVR